MGQISGAPSCAPEKAYRRQMSFVIKDRRKVYLALCEEAVKLNVYMLARVQHSQY